MLPVRRQRLVEVLCGPPSSLLLQTVLCPAGGRCAVCAASEGLLDLCGLSRLPSLLKRFSVPSEASVRPVRPQRLVGVLCGPPVFPPASNDSLPCGRPLWCLCGIGLLGSPASPPAQTALRRLCPTVRPLRGGLIALLRAFVCAPAGKSFPPGITLHSAKRNAEPPS